MNIFSVSGTRKRDYIPDKSQDQNQLSVRATLYYISKHTMLFYASTL